MIPPRVRPLLLVMIALAIVVESVYEYGVIKKSDDGPTAEQLLAALNDCNRVGGDYSPGGNKPANISICKLNGAFYWRAGMRIDCDGITTAQCNYNSDPAYQDDTWLHASNGESLNAANLPYVVLPEASNRWDYAANNIEPGAVVAVIYNGNVRYGVFGDIGPEYLIGEVSYAMVESLGIDPDPVRGGFSDPKVIYIVFPGSHVSPVENPDAAAVLGKRLANKLIRDNK